MPESGVGGVPSLRGVSSHDGVFRLKRRTWAAFSVSFDLHEVEKYFERIPRLKLQNTATAGFLSTELAYTVNTEHHHVV